MDFKIKSGLYSNLPTVGEAGTLYYTIDTQQFFVCVNTNEGPRPIQVNSLVYQDEEGQTQIIDYKKIDTMHSEIVTDLLNNINNGQLVIGATDDSGNKTLMAFNPEETSKGTYLILYEDGQIMATNALPMNLGGTGLSYTSYSELINHLLKTVDDSEAVRQLIDKVDGESTKVTYHATASVNGENIVVNNSTNILSNLIEGKTYKIKLGSDMPANARLKFGDTTTTTYPIVDLKGNAMRGGEAIKNSYIELTYSDGKFFFKGGGGERPRKLKGFVEFTEDGTFCPADYGLQVGDEIKIILVAGGGASGYWKKDSDHQCPVAQEKFHGDPSYFGDLVAEGINFAGRECVAQTNGYTSETLVISGAGGAGGYYPNFTPSAGRSISYSNYSSYASIPIEADDIDDVVNYYYYSPWEKNTTGGGCWAARPLATSETKVKAPQILPNFIPQAENGTFKQSFPNYIAGFGGYGYGAGAGASYIDQSTSAHNWDHKTYSGSSGKIIETTIQLNSLDEITVQIGKGRTKEDIQTLNSTVKSVNSGTDGYCSVSWDIDETI